MSLQDPSDSGEPPKAEIHHQHRDVNGGWLRPAVFGAMDGLVSNFALIAGVAGGRSSHEVIVLAGLAGLAAGRVLDGGGGVHLGGLPVRTGRGRDRDRAPRTGEEPPGGTRGAGQLYEARGLDPELAREVARQLSRDPHEALEIHSREELGVVPGDLPSPVLAAGSSFAAFSIGAVLPVLPYLLGANGLWPSALIAGAGLFSAGALVSRVTARTWWFSGLRQLTLGATAAAITYGVGALIG